MKTFKTVCFAACAIVFSSCSGMINEGPYSQYRELLGDLHVHSSTGSFDAKSCQAPCKVFSVTEQLTEARAAGLDFVAITEHDLDPTTPSNRISKEEWEQVLAAVARANTNGFIALAGYEWTSTPTSCYFRSPQRDYAHKIVILPRGAKEFCDSQTCKTPDALAAFVNKAGGVVITPHPWRAQVLDKQNNVTSSVSRNYFDYDGDGPGGVMIGAEIGPPYEPYEWKDFFCDNLTELVKSRTVTIEEWVDALESGKRLAVVLSSDRHFSSTPFGTRMTSVFVKNSTPEGIIEALLARRTHAANLTPFNVRFSVDRQVVGSVVNNAKEAVVQLAVKPEEFDNLEIWLGKAMIRRLTELPTDGRIVLSLMEVGKGALWVKVSGKQIDEATKTQRMTITSPIWLK